MAAQIGLRTNRSLHQTTYSISWKQNCFSRQ